MGYRYLKIKVYTKIILLWQFQMFYQKASAWGKTRELPEPEII